MGSFFAGVKAGTLGGILYVGGLALFNVFLLFAFKGSVLNAISHSYSQVCPAAPPVNSTSSLEGCFQLVVAVDVPYVAFIAFFLTLLYSGIFGLWYEWFPTKSPTAKGEVIAGVIGLNLVFFGFSGFYFDFASSVASGAFLVAWTIFFGYLVGRLYRRYTRIVEFESPGKNLLRILVDGRDFTGKARTLAFTSTHKVRAEAAEGASFKEWVTAGGVKVDDPRSFETTIEITGDGSLKAVVTEKY
ncbi:MAG: hypothetical protein OK404_00455 [Thaumarchaeota archaeon]|nr:hypothetical protein [Nitrososphaerota archaeon]